MFAVLREPVVLAAVLSVVGSMRAVAVRWLVSKERQRLFVRLLSSGKTGLLVEHRGADGSVMVARSNGHTARGGRR
jgi:hypothetical protein